MYKRQPNKSGTTGGYGDRSRIVKRKISLLRLIGLSVVEWVLKTGVIQIGLITIITIIIIILIHYAKSSSSIN